MNADELIAEAQRILGEDPLPADAEARLKALESQSPRDDRWAWIWEGFDVASADSGKT